MRAQTTSCEHFHRLSANLSALAHRHRAAFLTSMHLPSISHRERPVTATSPSTSPRLSSDPSNPHISKRVQHERRAPRSDRDEAELDLWYMTQPGEDRYWMYGQDDTQAELLRQRLERTFNRRGRRPHTPVEAPSAAFPQPTSESVRARLNLLKWLSSRSCLLFYECDDVVQVDDIQLDTALATAQSTTDGGAKAIQILMRWSKEGRRYGAWHEVQTELERLMADTTAATERGREKKALKRAEEEEQRRKDRLHQRIHREQQERFSALKQRQAEERALRQQRKQDADEQRNRLAQQRQARKLAALDHHRGASSVSSSSTGPVVESRAGEERFRRAGQVAIEKADAVEEEKYDDGDAHNEQDANQKADATHEQAHFDGNHPSAEAAETTDSQLSQPSSIADTASVTSADKEAPEEKLVDTEQPAPTTAGDKEDQGSSAQPSSHVSAALTPSPRSISVADRTSVNGNANNPVQHASDGEQRLDGHTCIATIQAV